MTFARDLMAQKCTRGGGSFLRDIRMCTEVLRSGPAARLPTWAWIAPNAVAQPDLLFGSRFETISSTSILIWLAINVGPAKLARRPIDSLPHKRRRGSPFVSDS